MPEACGITTSFATAAAMLRTWNGTTCRSRPRTRWVSGLYASVNSFSGGCAQSALGDAPAVKLDVCKINGRRWSYVVRYREMPCGTSNSSENRTTCDGRRSACAKHHENRKNGSAVHQPF